MWIDQLVFVSQIIMTGNPRFRSFHYNSIERWRRCELRQARSRVAAPHVHGTG